MNARFCFSVYLVVVSLQFGNGGKTSVGNEFDDLDVGANDTDLTSSEDNTIHNVPEVVDIGLEEQTLGNLKEDEKKKEKPPKIKGAKVVTELEQHDSPDTAEVKAIGTEDKILSQVEKKKRKHYKRKASIEGNLKERIDVGGHENANAEKDKRTIAEEIITNRYNKRNKSKKKRKRSDGEEMSLEEILQKLKSPDLSKEEREKLIHLSEMLSEKMGPKPKQPFLRIKFKGHKRKVRLVRSEEETQEFDKKFKEILKWLKDWLLDTIKKIGAVFGLKIKEIDPEKTKSKAKKKDGASSTDATSSQSEGDATYNTGSTGTSMSTSLPKLVEPIIITGGQTEYNRICDTLEKALVFLYSGDPEASQELKHIILEIVQKAEDTATVLAIYPKRETSKYELPNNVAEWTYDGVLSFVKAMAKDFHGKENEKYRVDK